MEKMRRSLGRHRNRWEDNIKMCLIGIGSDVEELDNV
jgi:hypothetical protein